MNPNSTNNVNYYANNRNGNSYSYLYNTNNVNTLGNGSCKTNSSFPNYQDSINNIYSKSQVSFDSGLLAYNMNNQSNLINPQRINMNMNNNINLINQNAITNLESDFNKMTIEGRSNINNDTYCNDYRISQPHKIINNNLVNQHPSYNAHNNSYFITTSNINTNTNDFNNTIDNSQYLTYFNNNYTNNINGNSLQINQYNNNNLNINPNQATPYLIIPAYSLNTNTNSLNDYNSSNTSHIKSNNNQQIYAQQNNNINPDIRINNTINNLDYMYRAASQQHIQTPVMTNNIGIIDNTLPISSLTPLIYNNIPQDNSCISNIKVNTFNNTNIDNNININTMNSNINRASCSHYNQDTVFNLKTSSKPSLLNINENKYLYSNVNIKANNNIKNNINIEYNINNINSDEDSYIEQDKLQNNNHRVKKVYLRNDFESNEDNNNTDIYSFINYYNKNNSITTDKNSSQVNQLNLVNQNQSNNHQNKKLFTNINPAYLVDFCCTKKGSKLVQEELEKKQYSEEDLDNMLNKLYPHIKTLIYNQFGNFLIQILLNVLNDKQITKIFKSVKTNLIEYCLHTNGNHTIQILIENIKNNTTRIELFACLKPEFKELCSSKFGVYVLQKIMELYSPTIYWKLITYIVENTRDLIIDENGLLLCKKFIYLFNPNKKNNKKNNSNKNTNSTEYITKNNISNSNIDTSDSKANDYFDDCYNIKFENTRQKFLFSVVKNIESIMTSEISQNAMLFLLKCWGVDYCITILKEIQRKSQFIISSSNSITILTKILSIASRVSKVYI